MHIFPRGGLLSFCIPQWPFCSFNEEPKLTVAMLIRIQISKCTLRNNVSLHLIKYSEIENLHLNKSYILCYVLK